MSVSKNLAYFIGGALFGTVGLKALKGRRARKVCVSTAAAALRARDEIMRNVEILQEECSDIMADAREFNRALETREDEKYIEESAEA